MATTQEILKKHLDNVKAKIMQAMEDHGRNASGQSVASLNIVVENNIGILYGSKSFLVMERGKKPGKVPFGFKNIIKQWIIDKGISVTSIPSKKQNTKYSPYERGLNSFAGALAFKIMKEGTSLFRSGGFNDIFTTAVNEELEAISKEMMVMSVDSIAKINDTL